MGSLKEFVDQIIEDGVVTKEEHESFMELVHADGKIDEEESEQISRIFRLISEGKVQVVDDEREQLDRTALEEAKAAAIQSDMERQEAQRSCGTTPEDEEEVLERREAIAQAIEGAESEREAGRNRIAEFFEQREKEKKR